MKIQIAAFFAIGLMSVYAQAHGERGERGGGGGGGGGGGNACKEDMAKFCASEKPGEGRLAACLKAHESELSAGCKAQAAEMKAKMEEWTEACKTDRETLCKDAQPGNGRLMACMHDNEAKLSKGCKAKFTHVKKHMEMANKECAADLKANCATSKTAAAKMQCLHERMDTLQPACKEHLDNMQ